MLRKVLPHAAIVLSGMYVVFFLIDRVNQAMAFINNRITKRLLLVLCVIAIIESIWLIRDERRKVRQRQARAARPERTASPSSERPRPYASDRRGASAYGRDRYDRRI